MVDGREDEVVETALVVEISRKGAIDHDQDGKVVLLAELPRDRDRKIRVVTEFNNCRSPAGAWLLAASVGNVRDWDRLVPGANQGSREGGGRRLGVDR